MRGRFFAKAVIFLSLFAILTSLFGCEKSRNKIKHHNISDITSIPVSCSHMDRSFGYSFTLTRKDDEWLFDADCFTHNHEMQTEFSGKAVKSDDIDTLYGILERNGTVEYVENYRKPKKFRFEVMDETVYGLCIVFSDNTRCFADSIGTAESELEKFFYYLAENADSKCDE